MAAARSGSWFANLLRERSVQVAAVLWVAASFAVFPLSGAKFPLNRPLLAKLPLAAQLIVPLVGLAFVFVEMGVTYFLTRRRTVPDMAARAPNNAVARREVCLLWMYGAAVLVVGRCIGLQLFGEGIGLRLDGAIRSHAHGVASRSLGLGLLQFFILLAVVPYVVFRVRGYSREALNLKSSNLRNDTLVVAVIMAMGVALDLLGGGFLKLSGHQMLLGGSLTFFTHLLGTGLPVMVFIYAILFPRFLKLTGSATTTVLLGGVSLPPCTSLNTGHATIPFPTRPSP